MWPRERGDVARGPSPWEGRSIVMVNDEVEPAARKRGALHEALHLPLDLYSCPRTHELVRTAPLGGDGVPIEQVERLCVRDQKSLSGTGSYEPVRMFMGNQPQAAGATEGGTDLASDPFSQVGRLVAVVGRCSPPCLEQDLSTVSLMTCFDEHPRQELPGLVVPVVVWRR